MSAEQVNARGRVSGVGRHIVLGAVTLSLVAVFWASRPQWSADMRLWRAVGDAAVILLFASLAMGPVAQLAPRLAGMLPWRRAVGIWTALAALTHSLLIINGWARWSVRRFLGYEYIPQLGREARLEPGFGLANLIGLFAVIGLVVLMATSSDRAVRLLGPQAWKRVHTGAEVVFYLVLLHSAYFLLLHYTQSFHRVPPSANWFRFPLVGLAVGVVLLRWGAIWQSLRGRRNRLAPRPAL